ncbi:hypothetical protein DFH11DRAFT_960182 [Phellopilus nigrolimitatus]|nr:hypothetical protein DFH11DRAFT_960182 [Phellopilus nigrolimitatus]
MAFTKIDCRRSIALPPPRPRNQACLVTLAASASTRRARIWLSASQARSVLSRFSSCELDRRGRRRREARPYLAHPARPGRLRRAQSLQDGFSASSRRMTSQKFWPRRPPPNSSSQISPARPFPPRRAPLPISERAVPTASGRSVTDEASASAAAGSKINSNSRRQRHAPQYQARHSARRRPRPRHAFREARRGGWRP